jgi:hypothetical protein
MTISPIIPGPSLAENGFNSSIGNESTSVGPGKFIHWICNLVISSSSTRVIPKSESG